MTTSIGVAMSGGGHRASVWGVGVLAAVVDAGLAPNVVSVSSVSGGSITNGVIAQNLDLHVATPTQFDAAVGPALTNFAAVGLFPTGPLTKRYFRVLIGALALSVVSTLALLVSFVVAATSWINGVASAVLLGVLGALCVAGWMTTCMLFARRGHVVRSALARTHFGGSRRSLGTRLDQVSRTVNHVFLATDLEAGDQFYLAPRFLYGFRRGVADPATTGTTLADAVQASAGLPGAFPPIILDTGPFRRPWNVPDGEPTESPRRVVLSDGGVYDNMADQWEQDHADRLERWPDVAEIQAPANVLVVANSSAAWGWSPFGSTRWPRREVTALMRNQGVQYDVSTARRRRALVRTWIESERRGSGQRGVIVMIDRSPYRVVDGFAHEQSPRGERAREALTFLGDGDRARQQWDQRARSNASVPTVLGALGVDATLDLLDHAYTNTLVGLYVVEGLGALRSFDRDRFAMLLSS